MAWEDIIADPEFQAQPLGIQTRVANNYFDKNMADDDFRAQPKDIRLKVRSNFLATLNQPEQEGFVKGFIKPTLKAIPKVAASTAAQFALMPGTGVNALIDLASGKSLEEAHKGMQETMAPYAEWLNPAEQKGAENINLAMKPFEWAGKGGAWVGRQADKGLQKMGLVPTYLEPTMGTMAEAGAMFAVPGIPKAVEGLKSSWWYRNLTIKERGLVDPLLPSMAAENLTAAEIRKLWKDPGNREALLKRYQGVGEEGTGNVGIDEVEAQPAGQGFELAREAFNPERESLKETIRPILEEVIQKQAAEIPKISTEKAVVEALPESNNLAQLKRDLSDREAWLQNNAAYKGTPMYQTVSDAALDIRNKLQDAGEVLPEVKPEPIKETVTAPPLEEVQTGGLASPTIELPTKQKPYIPENLLTRIMQEDRNGRKGLKFSSDYNVKEARQYPELKRVSNQKNGTPVDEMAQILADEGYRLPDGSELTGDSLIEALKAEQGKKIYTPEKAHDIIERDLRRQENEWIERQLADLEEGGQGETQATLKEEGIGELAQEGHITAEEYEAALKEWDDVVNEVKTPAKETPPEKALAKFSKETETIEGFGANENFNLVSKTPERLGNWEPNKPQAKTNKLFDERGSMPLDNDSEIVNAIRKASKNIKDAMPHLENLGRSIYESGKTKYFDWQRQMKATLGDMWERFKGKMQEIWKRISKPLRNERGAVGRDIYADNRNIKENENKIKSAAGEVKDIISGAKHLTDEYLGAISTRLANVDQSLKNHLRKMEMNAGIEKAKAIRRVEPMLQKIKGMSKEDKIDFDLARKNGDAKKLKEIITKYNMWNEYTSGTRKLLNELHEKAKAVGFDVGYRKHYHPRIVKDTKGFLEYFYKQEDWPVLERAIREKEAAIGRYLEVEEKAALINSLLRGYGPDRIKLSKPGQLKEREIEVVTPELNRFYMDSDGALLRYITTVTDAIEMRKAFGVKAKGVISPEDTIGHYILDLLAKGKIKPEDEPVLREIYSARFNEVGTRGIIGLYKNLSLIDTMGSPISAITQVGDLAWALYKGGPIRTINALVKAGLGKSEITKEDIGIDVIAKEFSDTSKASHAVAKVFRTIGLEAIDNLGKETLINSTIEKARTRAGDIKKVVELEKELRPIFESETPNLIRDLQEGKITENVKLLAFNTLADFQPIALSEMPQKYLTAGNGRIFYTLKSFTIKQFDAFRNEAFKLIANKGTRIKGLKNLVHLAACFVAANATADIIKNFILNRNQDTGDLVVDNLLRLAGISKFTTWKAREEGVGSAIVRTLAPPFKALDALTKDIAKAGDEKGLELAQSIPIFGKLYYWWFGKGATKTKERRARHKRIRGQ